MANINTRLSSQHEKILKKAFDELIFFGKVFLPDFKKSKTPSFHYEWADEFVAPSTKPCAIISFRGSAKSTLIKAKIVRDFCFSDKAKEWGFDDRSHELFVGWCSASQKKSINNVDYVKLNLKYSPAVKFYFGDLSGNVWNQENIITRNNNRLVSSSNLTSMRGDTLATVEGGAIRYSYVVADDIESEENTRTQASRDKLKDNMLNGVLPAIERNVPGRRLFYIGTPVHFDALAQNFLDTYNKLKKEGTLGEHSWKFIVQKAINDDGTAAWPEFFNLEQLKAEKKRYAESPRGVSGFYQEYMLEVQSSENALWTRDHIQYHKGVFKAQGSINTLTIDGETFPVHTFLGVDPATDIDTRESDYSVIMVVALDARGNVYILDYERHKSIPVLGLQENGETVGKKGVVDYMFDLAEKYNCNGGTVEDVAMNRSIFQSLRQEETRRGKILKISPEAPGGRQKLNRIYSGLNPYFANSRIFMKEDHYELIDEVIKFGPRIAHDDTIDSLWYALRFAYPPSDRQTVPTIMDGTGLRIRRKRPKSWKLA